MSQNQAELPNQETPQDKPHTPITEEQYSKICNIMADTTMGIVRICREQGIGHKSFFDYMDIVGDDAKAQYARAKDAQLRLIASETIDIADEPLQPGDSAAVNNKRVRIDTRKWLLSKLVPKTYGDQITVKDERTLPTKLEVELVQPKQHKSMINKDNELNDG
jgi:hypothetical protein